MPDVYLECFDNRHYLYGILWKMAVIHFFTDYHNLQRSQRVWICSCVYQYKQKINGEHNMIWMPTISWVLQGPIYSQHPVDKSGSAEISLIILKIKKTCYLNGE